MIWIALLFVLLASPAGAAIIGWVERAKGSDSNSCLSEAEPCATLVPALNKMEAANGGATPWVCPDCILYVKNGSYDTLGFIHQSLTTATALLSGTSWDHPFTIRAWKSGGGSCETDPPGFGTSSCASVRFVRALLPGSKTLAQMQSVGGPQCDGSACVGAPIASQCTALGYTFPDCWAGAPGPPTLWLYQDRSGQVRTQGIIETPVLESNDIPRNNIRYVVFDGIDNDAEGVNISNLRTGSFLSHQLTLRYVKFTNGTFRNSAASAVAQPGVANGVDYGSCVGFYGRPNTYIGVSWGHLPELIPGGGSLFWEVDHETCAVHLRNSGDTPAPGNQIYEVHYRNGERISSDYIFENFLFTDVGIPFDTLCDNGTTNSGCARLAREMEDAKYLHAVYGHTGGFTARNVEVRFAAGGAVMPDGDDNFFSQLYVHDNNLGVQMFGYNFVVENSVFKNNGNTDIQWGGLGGKTTDLTIRAAPSCNPNTSSVCSAHHLRNNTFIHGPRGEYNVAVQVGAGTYGVLAENNIILGYARGFEGNQCGIGDPTPNPNGTPNYSGDEYCIYTQRVTIRNNLVVATTPFHFPGTDYNGKPNDNPIVKPQCTNGTLNLATCNSTTIYSAAQIFASDPPTAPNYSLLSSGPAVNTGFNNGLTTDFIGNTRANGVTTGATVDIGAWEHCNAALGSCTAAPTIPVNTTITSNPTDPTSATSADFAFTGSGGTGPYTFQCQIDGGGYTTCTSPKNYPTLTLATHTFNVRAVDSLSVVDSTPAAYTWTIGAVVPPNTTIITGPATPTTAITASFAFSATGCTGACTFQCNIDSLGYLDCVSPKNYSALTIGDHIFLVRATDSGTGLTDASPAVHNWTITASGGGIFSVGRCIEVIVPSLNVRDSWNPLGNAIPPGQSLGARGVIVATDPTINGGFSGIQVDYYLGNVTVDGWHSVNSQNIQEIICSSGLSTSKIGGAVKVGSGARFGS